MMLLNFALIFQRRPLKRHARTHHTDKLVLTPQRFRHGRFRLLAFNFVQCRVS